MDCDKRTDFLDAQNAKPRMAPALLATALLSIACSTQKETQRLLESSSHDLEPIAESIIDLCRKSDSENGWEQLQVEKDFAPYLQWKNKVLSRTEDSPMRVNVKCRNRQAFLEAVDKRSGNSTFLNWERFRKQKDHRDQRKYPSNRAVSAPPSGKSPNL